MIPLPYAIISKKLTRFIKEHIYVWPTDGGQLLLPRSGRTFSNEEERPRLLHLLLPPQVRAGRRTSSEERSSKDVLVVLLAAGKTGTITDRLKDRLKDRQTEEETD